MNTFVKRTGGVLVMIISALVLLASIGGVIGLWIANDQAHNLTAAVFAPLESGLNTATGALENANTHLTNARTRVSNAQQTVAQLGQNISGSGAVLGAISDTVGAKLGTEIDEARESTRNTLAFVNGINNSIIALNELPNVNLPTLTDELNSLDSRITTLEGKIQDLRTEIQQIIQGKIQVTASRINNLLADLDSGLQNIQSVVNKSMGNIQQRQAQLASMKSDISSWITIGWIAATVFLLWIAISQVVMIRYGWSLLRNKPSDIIAPAAPTPSTTPTGEDLAST